MEEEKSYDNDDRLNERRESRQGVKYIKGSIRQPSSQGSVDH